MSTRFSGFRILAVSPMKRTPATTMVLPGCSWPKRAISSESETVPPVACGEVLQVRVDVVVRDQHGVECLQARA